MDIRRSDKLWLLACENPGKEIDIGGLVVCDACSDDYTDLPDVGGFIFSGMAVCPKCAVEWMPRIICNREQSMIQGSAADGQTFGDFVRAYRGPTGNKISIGPIPSEGEQ